jgi:hypothetical protein
VIIHSRYFASANAFIGAAWPLNSLIISADLTSIIKKSPSVLAAYNIIDLLPVLSLINIVENSTLVNPPY